MQSFRFLLARVWFCLFFEGAFKLPSVDFVLDWFPLPSGKFVWRDFRGFVCRRRVVFGVKAKKYFTVHTTGNIDIVPRTQWVEDDWVFNCVYKVLTTIVSNMQWNGVLRGTLQDHEDLEWYCGVYGFRVLVYLKIAVSGWSLTSEDVYDA